MVKAKDVQKLLGDAAGKTAKVEYQEITSDHVKTLAGRGLRHPEKLSNKEIQEICGSVEAHITREAGRKNSRINPLEKP